MSIKGNKIRTRKRTREIQETADKNLYLLDGLSLVNDGEYIKVDDLLLKRLKPPTKQSRSDDDIVKMLNKLFPDCPEFPQLLRNGKPITAEFIEETSSNLSPEQRKMAEMTATLPIDWLALKRTTMQSQNYEYRYKPAIQPRVTDQFHSGRCWLFASLNALRYEMIFKLDLEYKFEFSSAYLYFWDKIERANVFLESIWFMRDRSIDDRYVTGFTNPVTHIINDGGYWQYFKNLVTKYGLVPKNVYEDSYNCFVSDYMNNALIPILNQFALKIMKLPKKCPRKKFDIMKEGYNKIIYDLIVRFMGEPPKKFDWRYKNATGQYNEMKDLTPEKFFKVIVPHNFETKMTFVHDPRHPEHYYKPYHIEYALNMIGGDNTVFINLPLDVFKRAIAGSQMNGEPVWFACDVGASLDHNANIMDTERFDYEAVLGIETRYAKEDMMWMNTSSPTHAMVINGVDMDEPVDGSDHVYRKWRIENSWGVLKEMEWAEDEGCWQMSDKWFDEHVFMAVVDLKYFEEDTLTKIMENKDDKISIKPWDVFGTVATHSGCTHCKYTVPIRKKILSGMGRK